ncbi:MAG TPA: hypothetical protein DDW83_08650 [Peptococcaceae bacterium]|nr:hypothetical protein [Peptococcaceae bacterium]
MGQEQDLEKRDVSILSLMAQTLHSIDEKRADLPAMITVMSLFTLMSVVNMAQDVAKGTGTGTGGNDVLGMLNGMLSQGKPGPEMLTSLLQQSGKKVSPQMLSTLLSMVGEVAQKEEKPKPKPSEGRQSRG